MNKLQNTPSSAWHKNPFIQDQFILDIGQKYAQMEQRMKVKRLYAFKHLLPNIYIYMLSLGLILNILCT